MATVNENVNVKINIEGDGSMKSLRQMRLEMRELQKQMSQTTDPTKFKQLSSQFAQLRNDIKDVSAAMNYMDPGELLGGWIKMSQGVVGSFSAITGAMSLFGSENEAIQEIEKKSMVLIQTMMGLEQARQLLIDGGGRAQIKQIIQTTGLQIKQAAATAVQAVAQKGATLATEGTTIATRLLGKAMMSLPVMWLVAGLAAIVGGTVALVSIINKETEAERKRNIVLESNRKIRTEAVASTTETTIKLRMYAQVAEDTKRTEEERTYALGKMNEMMGTTLTLTDDLTAASEAYIQTLITQAQVDLIVKRLGEITNALADGKKLWEESEGNALQQAWGWAQRNLGGITGQVADLNDRARRFSNTTKDLTAEQKGLEEQLKKLTDPLLKNQKAADDAAAAQKKQQEAIDAANAAWEKRKALIKEVNDEYAKFLRDAAYNAETELGKIKFIYDEDLVKWQKHLADKLISQEQYDNWYRIRTQQFHKDILKKEEELYGKVEKIKSKSITKSSDEEIKLREVTIDFNETSYVEDVMSWDETNKTKLYLLREAHRQGTISTKEYVAASIELFKEEFNIYTGYVTNIAGQMSSIFSNITQMMTMQIEYEDKLWQDKYNTRNEALNNSLEKAKEVWGEESKQYKALLAEQTTLDEEKAAHDKKIEADKKAAANKYAKFQIGLQMAEATVAYGKGMIEAVAATITNPVWGAIMIGTLSAMYATQMALMTKQMSMVGKMRKGGYISGASHEQGGVLRELEGGEAVVNKNSMSNPSYRNIVSAINVAGGGIPYPNTRGLGQSSALTASIDNTAIEEIVNRIAAIPVIVTESDITTTQRKVSVIKNKTTLG